MIVLMVARDRQFRASAAAHLDDEQTDDDRCEDREDVAELAWSDGHRSFIPA
jgi:hypothetical protein